MAFKTRRQELRDFFGKSGIFMPESITAQEGIYCYVNNSHGNGLDGASPEERVRMLKEVNEQWKDKLVRNRKELGPPRILKVRYILPKTRYEVEKQIMDRGNGALEYLGEISPFKACVKGSAWRATTYVVFLDMLVLAEP